jgi:hypothetical protein
MRYRCGSAHVPPQPPRKAVLLMLADLEDALKRAGWRPAALRCERWREIGDDGPEYVARIVLECEPGELTRPLKCWFEWQHPRWRWCAPAGPVIESVAGLIGAPA